LVAIFKYTFLSILKGEKMKIKKVAKLLLLISLLSSLSLITPVPAKASFDISQAAYYDEVKSVLSISPEQEAMLEKYGFVVVELSALEHGSNMSEGVFSFDPALRFEDFYFYQVYRNDLPVFVTTDSILHLFHVVFDCSMKLLENQTLYPMAVEVTQFAFQSSLNDYQTIPNDGSLRYWAVRNSTVYFAVALSLLTGETVDLPQELAGDLTFYLDNIFDETPQFIPAGYWIIPESPYSVEVNYDFTQFTVRGHYLGDAQLEQYFRALMWYGRYPIFVPRNDERYEWNVHHVDEAAMVYMRDILKLNPEYYEKWLLLYNLTSALVGESDSINLLNLEVALHNGFGDATTYLDYVAAEGGLTTLREELSKPEYTQQILSQALVSQIVGAVLPRYPIVYQFMGQRYVPDSYIFQRLCWDEVKYNSMGKRRILPKGLDVFAVLGSERAYQLLIPDFDFEEFEGILENLTITFGSLNESDWLASSYTAWVHTLESLVNPTSGDYPEFMQTVAWQDEKLNTALGSWAQLRHDTILYAKQTYIPAFVCSYPEAFVEPNPTFYSRMQELCERTIQATNILELDMVEPTITTSLQTLKNVTQKLELISEKELAEEPLAQEEIDFIKQLAWNCESGGFIGWYVDTIHAIAQIANSISTLEVPVIADVATFPPGDIFDPPQILHVGTGYVNALVVLFPKPDGTLVAAVGPVFSYYEFGLIGTERLNDDEWKEILTWSNRTEYLPEWFQDVYGRAEPLPVPEYPNGTVFFVLMVTTLAVLVFMRGIKAKKKFVRTEID
jgi:hypothetical protein